MCQGISTAAEGFVVATKVTRAQIKTGRLYLFKLGKNHLKKTGFQS